MSRHLLVGWAAALLLLAGWLAPSQAHRADDEPTVPDGIKVPDGHKLLFKREAEGIQIYLSREGKTDAPEWFFKAPMADLFEKGKKAGYHYGGPTWESLEGGKVAHDKSEDIASVPSKNPKEDIPYLRIKVKAERKGDFRDVTYVLRLETKGGVAPSLKPARLGTETGVKYKAVYYFYGKVK
jgi:Protein of unknown function (DUF3455)